ncbi:RNA polymerase subunit sigma-70 [Chitinophaga caeni]|uniref:RNA polymerase subunit sigma-70 n=1 Tax=Chitinophaga caeni TaxID=2029983 RepID=A0A291QQA8_9BACT|nr:RNA polymerase sigma-70 factor [Chitinophaga caeni]ATL46062.1 RNA polymerase subunit sigma-70 [Chitinophaga caeni]
MLLILQHLPSMTVTEDIALLSLVKDGHHDAFKVLYDRYAGALIQFAYSKTGDTEDAKDAVQEVFIWLWQHKNQLQFNHNQLSIEAYLKTAVKNKILNLIDKKLRQQNYSDAAMQQFLSEIPSDHSVNAKELQAIIQLEINAMPAKMREIFELSRDNGYSNKQIAGKLDLSEQTVKNQLQHAKQRLKLKLSHYLASSLF